MSRKIAIVGFANSRAAAPYQDKSWEIWGVNDLYFHVPRVDVTFELHHLANLDKRRNAQHIQWLQTTDKPVYQWEANPAFPTTRPFPREAVMREFGSYFTNSISWMIALAALELSQPTELVDGRVMRLAIPGAQIGIWGVDMAAESEYGSQRPSCEYHVGVPVGMGIPVMIPSDSDLLKAPALYGIDTTANTRIKAESQIVALKKVMGESQQLLANNEAERRMHQSRFDQAQGQLTAWKYIRAAWTLPTDIQMGEAVDAKDRGPAMEGSPALAEQQTSAGVLHLPASDNKTNPVPDAVPMRTKG